MTGKPQPETAVSETRAADPAPISENPGANSGRRSRNPAARVCDEFRPRKKSTGARSTGSASECFDTPTLTRLGEAGRNRLPSADRPPRDFRAIAIAHSVEELPA